MAIGSAVPVAILRDAPLRSGAPQDEVALFFTRSLAGNDKPGSKNLGTDDSMLAKSAEPQTHNRPSWFAAGMPHIWLPYAQMKIAGDPLPVVATRGSRIILADGTELIDGIASWWTACHGYNHPHIAAAVKRQLDVMPHVMFGGIVHEGALTLARRLAALMPGLDRLVFSDSGSVAVEVAMKMAVQYWLNKGVRGRPKFVAFRGAYHGDTAGAMAVSDPEDGMHRRLGALLARHYVRDLPSVAAAAAQ